MENCNVLAAHLFANNATTHRPVNPVLITLQDRFYKPRTAKQAALQVITMSQALMFVKNVDLAVFYARMPTFVTPVLIVIC